MTNNKVIAIAWYKPEQWDLLRKVSADTNELENNYFVWLTHCNETLDSLAGQGIEFVKTELDVHDLVDWCNQNNKVINGEARTEFTIYCASNDVKPETTLLDE